MTDELSSSYSFLKSRHTLLKKWNSIKKYATQLEKCISSLANHFIQLF
jgi:hypothetical protein